MGCFCSGSALSLAANFSLPDFSLDLPAGLLSVAAAAQASLSASASLTAQLQASVGLSAALSLSALASASAMLSATGVFPPGISITLPALVASLNANLPNLSAALAFNTPSLANLATLSMMVSVLVKLGIDPFSASAAL